MISIYIITCTATQKVYIGQTKLNIGSRFASHKYHARNYIDHCVKLMRAIRKYGEMKFSIQLLQSVDTQEEANLLERKYIVEYDSIKNGYNTMEGGDVNYHTEETKQKLSKIRTGTKMTDESKQKISFATRGENNPFYGKHHTAETKIILSRLAKGNKYWLGKHHTEDTKAYISTIRKEKLLAQGEKNPAAKLTESDVIKIRNLFDQVSMPNIAKMFNVSLPSIQNIKYGKTWKHIR